MPRHVQQHRERIREVCTLLREAERPVRLLATLAWPPEIKQEFFARGAAALPRPQYPGFDPQPTFDAIAEARKSIGTDHPVEQWLARLAEVIEGGARMLAAVGTPAFFEQSRLLFGAPTDPLKDESSTSLELARSFHIVLDDLAHVDLGAPPEA
ncbi:MAG: tyrosine/phenylalanine carboxypeptidase domain-containing protein, partial [Gammaproteobacteria bacterium]